MTVRNFEPETYDLFPEDGKVGWRAPSNIALVKYWGKHGIQLPKNPSISFTLNACSTQTELRFERRKERSEDFSFDIKVDGMNRESFKPKIHDFFVRIESYLPFLKEFHFEIETSNTFPHSSGIASSASGMAALGMCLLDLETRHFVVAKGIDLLKASFIARLGSGSAARSITGPMVVWGEHPDIEGSSDLYGIRFPEKVHPIFNNFHDTILLVEKGQKKVSSSQGQQLMQGHPFASQRFVQAGENLKILREILVSGDLASFIRIVEQEALSLHAMMMTSNPYFLLMKPETLQIINAIWDFRAQTSCPISFTLDAGANVHVLYPETVKEQAYGFIKSQLLQFCEKGHHICDKVGTGVKKII